MIYVLSDIHGNLQRFDSVMEQIDLQPDDTLYVLGDVTDRHPHGIVILRRLMAMPNVKMLLGNHEYMMLNVFFCPDTLRGRKQVRWVKECLQLWYRNGGEVTYQHLLRQEEAVRDEIFDYLHALPLHYELTVNGKDYELVHGAPMEQFEAHQAEYPTRRYYAVWKRWMPDEPSVPGKTVIFGHTPTNHFQKADPMRIWYGDGRICIDCGAGYPADAHRWGLENGRLACLRLDDMQEFYSREDTEEPK